MNVDAMRGSKVRRFRSPGPPPQSARSHHNLPSQRDEIHTRSLLSTREPSNKLSTPSSNEIAPFIEEKSPLQPPQSWKEQILYFPMTDRFHDGNADNYFDVQKDHPYGFHGGDLAGLTEKLDYIKALGATAIWVSPIAENTKVLNLPDRDIYGYHGYWIKDHYQVDPRQGTNEDVKNMVEEAHERGLKVVLDVVLNHVGFDHPFVNDKNKQGWFHHNGDIRDWDDPFQRENGDLAGLPDLAQENPETYEYLLENPDAHEIYTARELEATFQGSLDAVVVGVSTGGQLTGLARYLKPLYPDLKLVGVDVQGSVIFDPSPSPYKMTGIGLSFRPPNLDYKSVHCAYVVPENLAYSVCHGLAQKEGLLLGSSSGAIVAAGLHLAMSMPDGSNIAMINPDRGDRYLETIYDLNWLSNNNFVLIPPEHIDVAIEQLCHCEYLHN